MTIKDLEKRLAALEAEVRELRSGSPNPVGQTSGRAWLDRAGMFRDDPNFWEAVKAGEEYRKSHEPGRGRKKKSARARGKQARS